jgi:serine protease Do
MIRLIGSITPGQSVQVEIFREGKLQSLSVELARRAEEPALMASLTPSQPKSVFGFDARELDSHLRTKYDIKDQFGLVVTQVKTGSLAEAAGLKPGDLISAVNGHEVLTQREFEELLNSVDSGGALFLLVVRNNETLHLTLERGEG